MQSSTGSGIQSDNRSYLRIFFYTLFLVFTIILFTMTWKIQNSCQPLVGKSLCVSESSSIIKRSSSIVIKGWDFTKHKSHQLFQKSWDILPDKLIFWEHN